MSRPRLLITGAGGRLARQLAAALSRRWQITGIEARAEAVTGTAPRARWPLRHVADVTGLRAVLDDGKFDAVLRLGRMHDAQEVALPALLRDRGTRLIWVAAAQVLGTQARNPIPVDPSRPAEARLLAPAMRRLRRWEGEVQARMPPAQRLILRCAPIVAPQLNNQFSRLLGAQRAPVLAGFSPMMQWLSPADAVSGISAALDGELAGEHALAPDGCRAYVDSLELAGAEPLTLPSLPRGLPRLSARLLLGAAAPEEWVLDALRYPVVLDATAFSRATGWVAHHDQETVLRAFREAKRDDCSRR